jgi:hypothetical protein
MSAKPKQARGPARWTKQVRFDIEFAKRMILEQGSCTTIMVLHLPGDRRLVCHPPADLGKETTSLYLRAYCAAHDAEGFAFISEAWMRNAPMRFGETEAEHHARIDAVSPAEAEDRIEVVMAQITYRDGDARRSLGEMREILRDAKGKVTGFGTLSELDGRVAEGRWTEVLLPEPPTAEQRASAARALEHLSTMGLSFVEMNG